LLPLPLPAGHGGPVLYGAGGWRLELPAGIEPVWVGELLARLP